MNEISKFGVNGGGSSGETQSKSMGDAIENYLYLKNYLVIFNSVKSTWKSQKELDKLQKKQKFLAGPPYGLNSFTGENIKFRKIYLQNFMTFRLIFLTFFILCLVVVLLLLLLFLFYSFLWFGKNFLIHIDNDFTARPLLYRVWEFPFRCNST